MALIMVLSTIVLMILLIQETVFETQVEHRSATAELSSLRAFYAAKAGMEINVLRIKNYININKKYVKEIESFRFYVDLIWKLPFEWPPFTPEGLDTISAEEFAIIKKNSLMQNTSFITSIEPTMGSLDINDLASPIPELRAWTADRLKSLLQILQDQQPDLELFSSIEDAITIVFNIQDWVDPDTQSVLDNAQNENNLYEQENLPPNRPFLNLDELKQVAGMTDTLYEALKPFLTVYGEKGLNINTAPVELLQALSINNFPLELAQEIRALTSSPSKPFLFSKESFKKFLEERGAVELLKSLFPAKETNSENSNKPPSIWGSFLIFDAPHNFKMSSTGFSGKSQKNLTAFYFDTPFIVARFKKLMKEQEARERDRIKKQNRVDTIRRSPQ